MVGPGEVDDDLEPEVKEECNGKYGDVSKVVIFEMPNEPPEEAVRIFIEFKRVESAIKGKQIKSAKWFRYLLLSSAAVTCSSCSDLVKHFAREQTKSNIGRRQYVLQTFLPCLF